MKRHHIAFLVGATAIMFLYPEFAWATVESTLQNFGQALGGRILPLIAILGLCFAGFSFVTGNPNAKYHLIHAVIGVGIGLGAKTIIDMVRQLVQ